MKLTGCLVLCSALFLAPDPARSQLPSGGDSVLIGRIFHRGASGTSPVGRFGMVLARDGAARARVEVPRVQGDPASGYVLELEASSRKGGARLGWRLAPSGELGPPSSGGEQEVSSGILGHAELAEVEGTRVYASLEHGRASSFDHVKLARHFGGGGIPPAVDQAEGATFGGPAVEARPLPVLAGSPSPQSLELSFRLERDGEPVFAPRVRVREGEPFSARSGRTFETAGGRWDGFELSGSARLAGGRCLLDLSVQSGRRLDVEGEATWLIDRYRRDVALPLDGESVLELFEDLEGESAGRTRLFTTCTLE